PGVRIAGSRAPCLQPSFGLHRQTSAGDAEIPPPVVGEQLEILAELQRELLLQETGERGVSRKFEEAPRDERPLNEPVGADPVAQVLERRIVGSQAQSAEIGAMSPRPLEKRRRVVSP